MQQKCKVCNRSIDKSAICNGYIIITEKLYSENGVVFPAKRYCVCGDCRTSFLDIFYKIKK